MPNPAEAQGAANPVAGEPHDDMWWRWLRLLLLVSLILAGVRIMAAVGQMGEVWKNFNKARSAGQIWLTPAFLTGVVPTLGIPAATLVFSFGCLQRRKTARLGLVISSWCELGFCTYDLIRTLFEGLPFVFSLIFWQYMPRQIDLLLYRMAIAGIVLYLLTRPQIKGIFSVSPSKGFEVIRAPDDHAT